MSNLHQIPNEVVKPGMAGFAIRHAHLILAIFIGVFLIGAVSTIMISKDLLPAGHTPGVQILSFYPGMPAEDVEKEITYPYERYTGQAVGVKYQESRSLTGVSIVRNYFQSSTDLGSAMAQTGSLVMSVLRKLPPGSQPPLILPFDPMASEPLAIVAVSGENKTETELQDVGRYSVINSIQSVPGAMAPTVMGGKLRQANIILDNDKLNLLNLSPLRVNEKIQSMNSFIPAGDINIGEFNYQLHSNAMFKELSEADDFYLRSKNGVSVKLKDVGKAEDGSARQTNIVTIDGQKRVYVPIYRQPGANSLDVIDQVKKSISHLEKSLKGFKFSIESDQTIFIRKAIDSITFEGLLGGGLAALMILFFLGSARATIAVLLTLPVSLIGAIAVLKAAGQTLNIMTLGGLALSVGVLVDNAIVVIEVIMSKQKDGLTSQQASVDGANEVAMPILASTLATLVIFVPVLFLSGIVETLFSALSISVVAALVISYYAAMTMVPLYAYYYLGQAHVATKGMIFHFQEWFKKITRAYGKSLHWSLARSGIILKWSFFLHFVFAGALIFFIGTELFPKADTGSLVINMKAASGLRVEMTSELAKKIEKKLREIIPAHDLKMVITNSGVYYGYSAAFTHNSGSQDSVINVELTENREHSSQYYAEIIRKEIPKSFHSVEFSIQLGGLLSSALNNGIVAPIDVQVSGRDIVKGHEVAEKLLAKIKGIKGVVDLRIQQRLDSPMLNVNIDRKAVSQLGLSPDVVVKNLVSAVSNSSSYNQQVWVDPKTGIDYLLGVQYPENSFQTKDQVLSIPVVSPEQDRSVKLGQFATIEIGEGASEINHTNLSPVIDIFMDSQGRDVGSVASDVQKVIDGADIPEGYTVSIRGEISEMKSSMSSLGWGFLLAASLVFLILVAQFKSFLMPAIIMTNVPKGIVGVMIMFALTKSYFSIQAAIGCIFVIGVSVSHSVLLLEYILERVKHVKVLNNAIVGASMARLRPITMTALASIFALLPMAIGIGHGSEANIPLGRAVIGGQILSTLLNFYLLPCLYHQIALKNKKKKVAHLDSVVPELKKAA